MSIKDPRFHNELPHAGSPGEYLKIYVSSIQDAAATIPEQALTHFIDLARSAIKSKSRVYVAGNGGSAAISDHLCCDWMKGTYLESEPSLRVHPLSSTVGLVTALGNDFGYEFVFSKQIEMLADKGDLVVLISSSGNSPNVLRAAEAAAIKGSTVVGMTGFSGGKLKEFCSQRPHLSIHVPLNNYGMVEDTHQMIMHVVAQMLSQERDRQKQK